ncbi:MAG: hypothetical protein HY276_01630 [Ignavibacteriales bacterium]|nr:hypothetical protein [Ignavibacteriales bacterium]MBI3786930.1 hypothetical protein [Ignavibacteriales bacterium]
MFFYHVAGVYLCSNRRIPGLVNVSDLQPDVRVFLGLLPPWLDDEALSRQHTWYVSVARDQHDNPALTISKLFEDRYFRLSYGDGTSFIIDRAGKQVWAAWPDPLTVEDTATYLLGPVLAFILRLRGITCLHGSAIALGDQAIAMLGPAGSGKSSTAAAFAKLGYPVLADDILALRDEGNVFLIHPGDPQLCLWPASVKALFGSTDVLPRLTPNWDKHYLDLTTKGYQTCECALPLAAIYILDERSTDPAAPFVAAMTGHAGFIGLVANAYGNLIPDEAGQNHMFDLLGRIMVRVPSRRVTPRTDIDNLSLLCEIILKDFHALGRSCVSEHSQKAEHV